MFVNAATWGLLITGKLVATHNESGLRSALTRIIARSGEPLIRNSVAMAMRVIGEQFVAGETIAEALANARPHEREGFRYSYDMLGEAALTEHDAQRYLQAYRTAIDAIGRASAGRGIYDGAGISIKLSALHPRYSYAQRTRALTELYPRLVELSELAARFDIGLNIDAEEADRLELSLDLLEKLCFEPALRGWNGIGFVVQAYQKRCPYVLDCLIDLAHRSGHRLMVRLVKGAYWDSEIKRAQVEGLADFPVFTRKVYTDVSYLACANKLLAASDAVYPQFATHNAHTLAAIYRAAGENFYPGQYEFQCLHGMGEPLYSRVVAAEADGGLGRPCRIYAPVGTHETLLAYLVRRLLENGANTSFVNRIADEAISIAELVADPVATVEQMAQTEGAVGVPHPAIALPRDLFGTDRRNSIGIDLNNEHALATLSATLSDGARRHWIAAPMIGDEERMSATPVAVPNPADRRDCVGDVFEATERDISDALATSMAALPAWRATSPTMRADTLTRAAHVMEAQMPGLIGIIVREAGKTIASAIGEVREAVDFLRYYAAQVRREFANDTHRPLGVVVCISPWNFPLSIFTGQIAAALAAGNTVIAKPAEQTPLVAAQAIRLLRRAGVPVGAVQLLPGRGETVGAALVADARIRAVVFTGSTQVARALQKSLSGRLDECNRPLTLIAETGGLNAMIVDSSALVEQAVGDAIKSAFDSAGQRCSALRVLCVQDDVADRVLEMLLGSLQEQRVGQPDRLDTDVGPVIDDEAKQTIEAHVAAMKANGRAVHRFGADENQHGSFVAPTVIELNSIDELEHEVFGPVLHFVRYKSDELTALIDQINATGYGLTLGVHTRIDETIDFIAEHAHVGNQYVNRNMIGAVVGAQPFGGEGLSGTGPKAGGPLYTRRLLSAAPVASIAALDGDLESTALPADRLNALHALRTWFARRGETELAVCCDELAATSVAHLTAALPGPTGERNTYTLVPREAVLCIATDRGDLLFQLACVLAADSSAVWPAEYVSVALRAELPQALQQRVHVAVEPLNCRFDVAIIHHDPEHVIKWSVELASRDGAIVALTACVPGARDPALIRIERFQIERSLSINTAAAGGNASLMTIG